MLRLNKNQVGRSLRAVLAAGLCAGFLAGDKALVTATPAPEQLTPNVAAQLIAQRYSCAILKVIDLHQPADQHDNPDGNPRDHIQVSLELTSNPAANAALATYESDDTVVWLPPSGTARVVGDEQGRLVRGGKIANNSHYFTDQGHDQMHPTFSLFPRDSWPSGTNIEIYIANRVSTFDEPGKLNASFIGYVPCGTLARTEEQSTNRLQWGQAPVNLPLKPFVEYHKG